MPPAKKTAQTTASQAGSDLPIILFATPAEWTAWLEEHGAHAKGIWVRMAKKNSGIPSIDYAQAVEVALCFGWIDGLKRSYDEETWLQKFTPRGPKSIWSQINRAKAQALIESGQMRAAGMATVAAAQADGRWDAAYASPSNATVPDDLQAALDANPAAQAFFATLDRANRYAVIWRVQQAKRPVTRAKRIADYVAMLARHEKIHT
jgi:uncharacterized protein YdeI (YjbR/CyaY-like superfamily)